MLLLFVVPSPFCLPGNLVHDPDLQGSFDLKTGPKSKLSAKNGPTPWIYNHSQPPIHDQHPEWWKPLKRVWGAFLRGPRQLRGKAGAESRNPGEETTRQQKTNQTVTAVEGPNPLRTSCMWDGHCGRALKESG